MSITDFTAISREVGPVAKVSFWLFPEGKRRENHALDVMTGGEGDLCCEKPPGLLH